MGWTITRDSNILTLNSSDSSIGSIDLNANNIMFQAIGEKLHITTLYKEDASNKFGNNVITLKYKDVTNPDTAVAFISLAAMQTYFNNWQNSVLLGNVTAILTVLATAQDLTASYANLGNAIDVDGKSTIGLFLECDVNTSENVKLKALGLHTSGGTRYEIDGLSEITLWVNGVSDFNKYYEFAIGTLKYVQFQVIAGTVGTAGNITASYNMK